MSTYNPRIFVRDYTVTEAHLFALLGDVDLAGTDTRLIADRFIFPDAIGRNVSILLEGDQQDGTDKLLLEGDQQDGTDALQLESTAQFDLAAGDVNMRLGVVANFAAGAFAYSGVDARLLITYRVDANTGALNVEGNETTFRMDRRLQVSPGSFSAAGTNVDLPFGFYFGVASASFTYAASDIVLQANRRSPVSVGEFALTGRTAGIEADRLLTVAAGTYALTGRSVELELGTADPVLLLEGDQQSGTDSVLLEGDQQGGGDRLLIDIPKVEPTLGEMSLTGNAATLHVTRRIVPQSASLVVSGQPAALFKTLVLSAQADAFTLNGIEASFSVIVGDLLLEGDRQSGGDRLLLEGDQQSGTDILIIEKA